MGSPEDLLIDDGSNPRLLEAVGTDGSGAETASWAPTGRELAVAGTVTGAWGISVVPTDGGAPRSLAEGLYDPVWSPRGDLIAALATPDRQRRRQIVLLTPDASSRKVVVEMPSDFALFEQVAWSPDGGTVVFSAYQLTEGPPAES